MLQGGKYSEIALDLKQWSCYIVYFAVVAERTLLGDIFCNKPGAVLSMEVSLVWRISLSFGVCFRLTQE